MIFVLIFIVFKVTIEGSSDTRLFLLIISTFKCKLGTIYSISHSKRPNMTLTLVHWSAILRKTTVGVSQFGRFQTFV